MSPDEELLYAATARIEASFAHVSHWQPGTSPTDYAVKDGYGPEYVTMTAAGLKPKGWPSKKRFETAQAAIASWESAVMSEHQACGSLPVLAWRQLPELDGRDGQWDVWSRLAFAEKLLKARDAS